MFRVLLEKDGIRNVQVESCGTSAFSGMPPSDLAVKAAAAYGADIANHRSRAMSRYLLELGDLFVCMTDWQRDLLADHLPSRKLRVLGGGISDPFGGDQDTYDRCAAQIYAALLQLKKEVRFDAD